MKRLKQLLFLLCIFSMICLSCRKDEVKDDGGDSTPLSKVLTKDMINDLKSAGLKIYTGDNPPDIDGIYHLNPLEVSYNTIIEDAIDNYPIGKILSYSLKIQILSKNKGKDFSLQYDLGYFNQFAKDYFIMGSGNDFTMVYTKYDPQAFGGGNDAATFAYLISGTLENNGLKNVQVANIVTIENSSNVPNAKTMLGTLRIVKDKDGNSEKVASL